MMRLTMALLVTGAMMVTTTAHAQKKAPLPLKRVRLYETGIGYFERTGALAGGTSMQLPVPAGHLDDALKSLVVLSKDGNASVDGIEFSSSVSRDMARALAGLPHGGDEAVVNHFTLLESLKSAPVEIKSNKSVYRGRLIEVVRPPAGGREQCESITKPGETKATKVCKTKRDATVLLLTDAGEIRRFQSSQISSVKPTNPAWKSRLGSALDALSKKGAQGARQLRVHGQGSSAVTLGYVAETPVWRSTYRLVLANKDTDVHKLQGWALLHNDTDEDWKQVRVELVNGRPDSFLFPLAAPRYARRQLVTPERELSTVPQLMGKTVDNMWSGEGGLGLSGIGYGGGGRGEGIGLGSVGTMGYGSGSGRASTGQSALLAVGNLASLAQGEGVESGALFRYALPKLVNLRANGSALLPFVDSGMSAKRVAYFAEPGKEGRAAVHLTNRSRQTLPAGPISVFGAGGFAGETALPRTKPGERRILRYGFDMDVELNRGRSTYRDEPRHLRYRKGQIVEHFMRRRQISYELVNRSGAARTMYLVLPYVSNADVKGADGLTYDEERSQALAVFNAPANSRKSRDLTIREGLRRTHGKKRIDIKLLEKLMASESLPPRQRAVMRASVEFLEVADRNDERSAKKHTLLRETERDIKRLRGSLSALRAHSDGAEKLTERLLAAEERVAKLRKQLHSLQDKSAGARKAAMKNLKELNKPLPKAKK